MQRSASLVLPAGSLSRPLYVRWLLDTEWECNPDSDINRESYPQCDSNSNKIRAVPVSVLVKVTKTLKCQNIQVVQYSINRND
jgi:hypothetical protein